MFARHVTLQLRPEIAHEFPRLAGYLQKEILPLLLKQKGFIEELFLIDPNQTEAVAISLWEKKEHAEKFNREVYPTVVKLLNKYLAGAPVVKEFESLVAGATVLHKLAKAAKV